MADTVIPSLVGGIIEKFLPAERITFTVKSGGTAVGGKLMEAAAGSLKAGVAGASSLKVVGVALHDAAAGEAVTVAATGVWFLKASGTINAGDRVRAAASGDVVSINPDVTATPTETTIEGALAAVQEVVGYAVADIANGALGPVKLTL